MDPSQYPDDLDMPELEDIVYSDDEEEVGVEADLSNLETNIPVSPILTTIVHKDHLVNQIIGDLNSAPQTRSMTKMIIRVGGITKTCQSFEDMLKGFDREDLLALWNLVKEKFSSAVPSKDREKALWVELKRLFEPDADDVLWNLQRYMYAPLT
nr:hypothetical protein [Tanacetum cinerariifolium]